MLDRDKFLTGFKLWLENGCGNHNVVYGSEGSVDCGEIDGTAADEIVQYSLFGDVVFA